jgi:hypothetical protein
MDEPHITKTINEEVNVEQEEYWNVQFLKSHKNQKFWHTHNQTTPTWAFNTFNNSTKNVKIQVI